MKKIFVAFAVAMTMVMSVMTIGSGKAYAAEYKQMACKQYASNETRRDSLLDSIMVDLIWIVENNPEIPVEEVMSMDAAIKDGVVYIYTEAISVDGEILNDTVCFNEDDMFDAWLEARIVRMYGEQGIWS